MEFDNANEVSRGRSTTKADTAQTMAYSDSYRLSRQLQIIYDHGNKILHKVDSVTSGDVQIAAPIPNNHKNNKNNWPTIVVKLFLSSSSLLSLSSSSSWAGRNTKRPPFRILDISNNN